MKATVTILDQDFEVEYEFKITAHGCPATGPSYSCGGEPAQGPEFEIEIIGMQFCQQAPASPDPEIPAWLDALLVTHLSERDDVYDIVCRADEDRAFCDDRD